MARILRRPRADRDLTEIWQYIADQAGAERAEQFTGRIETAIRKYAEHPFLGRRRDELRPNLRSFPIRRYVVFYHPLDDGIGVVRILFGGRDIETTFAEEDD
jgi:toxin ParE1/3/4